MEEVFKQFDHWWADARCDPRFTQHGWDDSGSTAVVGMVSGQQLVVANAGGPVTHPAQAEQSRRSGSHWLRIVVSKHVHIL